MEKLKHWTGRSLSAFVHRLSFDFITQIQKKLEKSHVSKRKFATVLNVTPGRVSQVFNEPGNISLESAVQYAHGAGMKVALVAYDDNDPENNSGPVNSEIFYRCWRLQGSPKDFLELATVSNAQMVFDFVACERTSVSREHHDEFHVPIIMPPELYAGTHTNHVRMVQ